MNRPLAILNNENCIRSVSAIIIFSWWDDTVGMEEIECHTVPFSVTNYSRVQTLINFSNLLKILILFSSIFIVIDKMCIAYFLMVTMVGVLINHRGYRSK